MCAANEIFVVRVDASHKWNELCGGLVHVHALSGFSSVTHTKNVHTLNCRNIVKISTTMTSPSCRTRCSRCCSPYFRFRWRRWLLYGTYYLAAYAWQIWRSNTINTRRCWLLLLVMLPAKNKQSDTTSASTFDLTSVHKHTRAKKIASREIFLFGLCGLYVYECRRRIY